MRSLPAYWTAYLPDKIERIQSLQQEAPGKTFSFVFLTDLHYKGEPASFAPLLAEKIMDACHIPYAILAGDSQRSRWRLTKEEVLAEAAELETLLAPVRDRLLQIEGNHDCVYGELDRDGDGVISNTYPDGTIKPANKRETYVCSCTPEEIYDIIYRKVSKIPGVHFSKNNCAYYIDDAKGKVRYIGLNSQCNPYALQEDGTAKYPKMWLYQFTQLQLDFLIESLQLVPGEGWSVVLFAHCPLEPVIGDYEIIKGILSAYQRKTAYRGEYPGKAENGFDKVSVDVDFSNAKGALVGYFSGHIHADSVEYVEDIPVLTTTCVAHHKRKFPDRTEEEITGTLDECSLDVFTVNPEKRTVFATRIGYGKDRTFTY